MFKKNESRVSEKIDTLVGKNTVFEGTLHADGTVRIDGEFKGDVHIKGNIIIGKEGAVLGNITANNVIVCGCVNGNVTSSNQLKIHSLGKVFGDILVSNFIIEEKAVFEGNCKMTDISQGNSAAEKV